MIAGSRVQVRCTGTANRYPALRSVRMMRGASGRGSSLRRRRRTCTSMLRSETPSCRCVACTRYSRLSGRCGALRKTTSKVYSPLVNRTGAPAGSVRRRVVQSSCQPQNRKWRCSRSRDGAARPASSCRSTACTRASNSCSSDDLTRESSTRSSSPMRGEAMTRHDDGMSALGRSVAARSRGSHLEEDVACRASKQQ